MVTPILALFVSFLCIVGAAKAQEPNVTVTLDPETTVVGQPVVLRIKVLVPTWMPKPPVFPNFEVPSVMVRLPERASGPVSETIDRETWSGVQRAYRLYPLEAGVITLPAGVIGLTYAEPGATEPLTLQAPIPEIQFTATVPDGARGLDPLVIANEFTLEQVIEGETEMAVGGALTRTITAGIDGTTPVLIPAIPEFVETNALRAYPDEPVVTDVENRGALSGKRVDTVTYVGQAAGKVTLPEISVDWFNLKTGAVETASIPSLELTITGAAGSIAAISPRDVMKLMVLAMVGVVAVWGLWRFAWPAFSKVQAERRALYEQSEKAAFHRLSACVAVQDLSGGLAALDTWLVFFPNADAEGIAKVREGSARIGWAKFAASEDAKPEDWRAVSQSLKQLRHNLLHRARASDAMECLPSLNP